MNKNFIDLRNYQKILKTNDRPLTDLMKAVDSGAAQLPDFQRGWVWDNERIKALILSVIRSFPVGAAMFLEYGNKSIQFKHKPFVGWHNVALRIKALYVFTSIFKARIMSPLNRGSYLFVRFPGVPPLTRLHRRATIYRPSPGL